MVATNVGTHCSLVACISMCGWAINLSQVGRGHKKEKEKEKRKSTLHSKADVNVTILDL